GVIETPATTFDGWTVIEIATASPARTLNVALVAFGSPGLVARICLPPVVLTLRLANVAMPLVSLGVALPPESVPPPTRINPTGVPAMVLPNASTTFTCTGGAMIAPATTADGGTTNDIVAAAAGETVKEPLVAVGITPLDAVSDLEPTRSTLS